MNELASLIAAIPAPDRALAQAAQHHLDGLVKPVGSLGRLERLAVQLAAMPGLGGRVEVKEKAIVVMCADHGVHEEGITVAPQVVTALQAQNMLRHNTGVCVLAASAGAQVHVVDIGINSDPLPGLTVMKLARGSGNIARGPAMPREQALHLLLESARFTQALAERGVRLFGVGELGMGNTTAASAMVSVLTGRDPEEVVGIGANFPQASLPHKVDVVRRALAVNQPVADDGLDVLAKVGGYDLVGMAGVMLGAASCGLPVVLDGFLSYASALAACRITPALHDYLIASHVSAEKGAQAALQALGLEPFLHMEMRLGEGSGAALAMPLMDAACAIYQHMGTLAQSDIVLPTNN
ncbi:nicotinate-nucleotide--dimethylbenzimidazole phosphoribosyltransferase [Cronobacter turicensis]|nr:nicotinate-nucleotide--dimethylbenzimidazole phosphoribosyltransferase [Cronobacter turicensis]EKY1994139.1 nicotinate-nucleotide--dimethylbenzimidazole phosphoribosyltransferase [Cronobacter turicensis]ELY7543531.1 nicotinate-nucleotide--dimethylbenzimidazole phosphoribosyltransferase [Cronobacter turicensis]